MRQLNSVNDGTVKMEFKPSTIRRQRQIIRHDIRLFASYSIVCQRRSETSWYDPIGDHLGHYDIDGVSQYYIVH